MCFENSFCSVLLSHLSEETAMKSSSLIGGSLSPTFVIATITGNSQLWITVTQPKMKNFDNYFVVPTLLNNEYYYGLLMPNCQLYNHYHYQPGVITYDDFNTSYTAAVGKIGTPQFEVLAFFSSDDTEHLFQYGGTFDADENDQLTYNGSSGNWYACKGQFDYPVVSYFTSSEDASNMEGQGVICSQITIQQITSLT